MLIDGRRSRSLLESDKLQFVDVSGQDDKLKFVGHSNQDIPRDSYTATIFILP